MLVSFCLRESLTFEQTVNWMNIAESIFMECAFDNPRATREYVAELFSKKLGALQLDSQTQFPIQKLNILTKFFAKDFLQHLESYQYVCMESPDEFVEVSKITVQTPLVPMPLMSAMEIVNSKLTASSENVGGSQL